MELDNSASHSSGTFIGQFKRKPLVSCEKDVKELSKSNQTLSVSSRSSKAGSTVTEFIDFLNQFVSRKLPAYPSPNLTLTLTSRFGQNVSFGEG